jgi:phage repressor protein C with HTH and peptisase S24 domain
MSGKSKSAKYFAANPDAAENKRRIQRKINKSKKKKKYRAFLVKKNRKAGTYGNGDGKDYDHTEKKFMSAKRNRSKK